MKRLFVCLIVALSCVPFTHAEESFILPEMVVTATGSEKETFDTSQPVNLVEQQDLEEKVAVTIAEIFHKEPGVDVVTAGPGSVHPVIRGLSGERVLALVSGIRLSEQRPGGNHVFSLDPAQVERVEVVRGPASVLYGSDAIGGVVNFITKGAEEETGAEPRFGGETDIQYEGAADGLKESAHLRFGKGRFNGYVGGSYKDAGNIETVEGELANSFYDGYTVWGGGNYIGDVWKTSVDYSFMEADIGIPASAAFKEDYFKGEKHQRLALGIEANELSENVDSLKVDFGWQRHNRHRYRLKTDEIPSVVQGDMEVDIHVDIDTYTLKPQMVLIPNDTHRVTFGLDMFYEDATSDRNIRDTDSSWVNPMFDGVPVIPDSTRVGVGAFVQDEVALGERWVVTPGLRADWIEAQTDGHPRHQLTGEETSTSSAISGNLGVLYKVSNMVNLYGNLGRAFRAPTLMELYFYGPHDVGNDFGDPNLDPETSWNFDIGIKTRTDRLQTTVSLFYNMIDDYIVKENQGDGNYLYMNYANVSLYGAEAGLDYELSGGFSTFASVSYVRGENDDTGEDLSGIPPLKVRYGVRYDTFFGAENALWVELSGLTASDQDKTGDNERKTDGYTRGDVRMGIDIGEIWSFVAAVENFTDESYQDHLSSVWQSFGLNDQPGLNVKTMLKARF
ncbi:TonB-dependent receptor [uncultured Desulfuromusa sp.]|uniref:TonB-dependent receptor n=1 Tax=uncultured Desulfuromusa sp. TaxID=219183 RepID=UPI002AA6AF18|nr:TonB-dependent receptor [uncultured Desulfuromusa sp.]